MAEKKRARPWETEEAAFAFLLRVLAVCLAVVAVALLVKLVA